MTPARVTVLLAAAALLAVDARAGLFEDLYRGLDLLATPSGVPVFPLPDGGLGNGQRQGRLRIVPDGAGQGYTLEFDRTFGADSRGRPEILDLGAYELELAGQVQATAGYTSRGYLIGNMDLTTSNISYRLADKTGFQDYEVTGTLSVDQSMEVNLFGFYTSQLSVSNADSRVTLDGVLFRDTDDISFDVGPINVEGNIYFDAVVGALGAIGVDTSALAALMPKSPIDVIAEELAAQYENAARVAGMSTTADETSVTLGESTFVGPLTPDDLVAGTQSVNPVPEPGTLILLAFGGALFGVARRR